MADLTDTALDGIERELAAVPVPESAFCPDETSSVRFHLHVVAPRLIAEIRRHRAAKAADAERIRKVVIEVVRDALDGSTTEHAIARSSPYASSEIIADRVAEQLATSAERLDEQEIAQLRHHVRDHRATCSYSCSIIERLISTHGAKP